MWRLPGLRGRLGLPAPPNRLRLSAPDADDARSTQAVLGKRTRDHAADTYLEEDTLFVPQDSADGIHTGHAICKRLKRDENNDGKSGDKGDRDLYNAGNEPLPRHPAYDDDFPEVLAGVRRLGAKALSILKEADSSSYRVKRLQADANDIVHPPEPPRLQIGMFGDTGAGKSSTINSVLDTPGLAKANSSGHSCTHCVTKYAQAFLDQISDLAAEIHYFDINDIQDMLNELLAVYNIWNFSDPDNQGWDSKEREDLRRQSANAFQAFRALFCDKDAFRSETAARSYLERNKMMQNAVVDTFTQWAEGKLLHLEERDNGSIRRVEAENIQTFTDLIEPLLFGTSHYIEPALWPLVKDVTIGIKGAEILEYVTLVDMPGLDDTNKIRVKATHQQIDQCDYMWIVARLERAITDLTIDELLGLYAKGFAGKVLVILTRTDDGVESVVNQMKREGQDMRQYEQYLKQEKNAQKNAAFLAECVSKRQSVLLDQEESPDMTSEERSNVRREMHAYTKQLNGCKQSICDLANKRLTELVNIRRHWVGAQLTHARQDLMPEGTQLRVISVSNPHYEANTGVDSLQGPMIEAESTGIPELRGYTLEIAAPVILQHVENHVYHKAAVFIKALGLWANSVSAEHREELLDLIQEKAAVAGPILDAYVREFLSTADSQILRPTEKSRPAFVNHALVVMSKKHHYAWNTIRAFVRRNGNYQTATVGKESWNAQFLKPTKKFMNAEWDDFRMNHNKQFERVTDQLVALTDDIENGIKQMSTHFILPMQRIGSMLDSQAEGIRQACSSYLVAIERGHRKIEWNTTHDRPSGYLHQAMLPAYEDCSGYSGPGVKIRMLSRIESHLQEPEKHSPFAIAVAKMRNAIGSDAEVHYKVLQTQIESIMAQIRGHLDSMIKDKAEDPAEQHLKYAIKTFLASAEKAFKNVEADLERIKRKYEA